MQIIPIIILSSAIVWKLYKVWKKPIEKSKRDKMGIAEFRDKYKRNSNPS
jgi:hypothetical protein